jgi:hypothetical protein
MTPRHSRDYRISIKGTCGSIIGFAQNANPSTKNRYHDIASRFGEKRLQPIRSGKIEGIVGKNCAIIWILGIKSDREDQIRKVPGRLQPPGTLG